MSSHQDPRPLRVVVYSDDRTVRSTVINALGTRPETYLPDLEYVEVATAPALMRTVDSGDLDLLILDGEATPAGGLGIAKQLKDEVYRCPPVLVLTGRPQDAWLATWSRADGVVGHPIDPGSLAEAVCGLLKTRAAVTARR
jgi:DNA-binding NarL/FixJ family response regulator